MSNNECATHNRLGTLLIMVGVLFALDSWLGVAFVYKLWPLLILMLGSGLIGIFVKRRGSGIIFLIIGEYLVCFSLLALYCNFSAWSELEGLWPFFIYFLSVVFISLYFLQPRKRVWLLLFFISVSLALLFFLVFSMGFNVWWVILILAGFSILLTGRVK